MKTQLMVEIKDPARAKHHNFIIKEVNGWCGYKLPKNIHILDIGCGVGELSIVLGNLGYNVLGLDIHEPSVMEAKRRNIIDNVFFRCQDAMDLNLENKFDIIILSDVLEHLCSPEKTINKVNYLLKIGGILIITIPNGYGPSEVLRRIYHKYLLNSPMHSMLRRSRRIFIKDSDWRPNSEKATTSLGSADIFPHVQFFTFQNLKTLLRSGKLRFVKRKNGSFISSVYIFKLLFETFLVFKKIDILFADILPSFLVSSWFIVVKNGDS